LAVDRRTFAGRGRHTIGAGLVAVSWQGFEIACCCVEADLAPGTVGDAPRDRRPEPMLDVLLLLERPDAMVTGNTVSIRSMKRDQFVGLTNDVFATCPSLTPPMRHRHPSANSACARARYHG
jgi:hypothetical protein